METTLTVNGMHCDACVTLVKMEIEDIGLADKVQSIVLKKGENQGEVLLRDVSSADVSKISTAINNLERYNVKESNV